MDDYLHLMLRRALTGGLSFRMRLDEDGRDPTLYLRLVEDAGETTWAATLGPDTAFETALLDLFASCAQKIVEIGERGPDAFASSGRPLPARSGLPDEP